MSSKRFGRVGVCVVLAVVTILGAPQASAQAWNIDKDLIGLAVVGAEWTIDQDFAGQKSLIEGRYGFYRKVGEFGEAGFRTDTFGAVLDAHLQYGLDKTGLEYYIASATPWATQRVFERNPEKKKFQASRDQLELGTLLYSRDDPLGIESYTEITIGRIGREWTYYKTEGSPWSFRLALKVSLGWAWAESIDPRYEKVSNAVMGTWGDMNWGHEKYGYLYTRDRLVPGVTLGRPDQQSTTREARVRFGYYNTLYRGLTLDIFVEKRSFNFADPVETDLYTLSKRYGVELSWEFGGK